MAESAASDTPTNRFVHDLVEGWGYVRDGMADIEHGGIGKLWSGICDWFDAVVPATAVPIASGVFALAVAFFGIIALTRAAKLLSATLYHEERWKTCKSVRDVLFMILHTPISSFRFQTVQMLIESSLLTPPPEKPMAIRYEMPTARETRVAYKDALQEWVADRKDWKKKRKRAILSLIRGAPGAHLIQVGNIGEITDARAGIERYFNALADANHISSRFFSDVEVNHGFVAPLFLITGLIDMFAKGDYWEDIIRPFGEQIDKSPGNYSRSLAELRLFQFNCWLLWGPSIPVCTCKAWSGGYITHQYGFGDENRSVDLLMKRPDKNPLPAEVYDCLRSTEHGPEPQSYVMAGRCTVRGIITWGPTIASGKLGSSQQTIRDRKGKRIVLDMVSGGQKLERFGGTSKEVGNQYYSGYLWVIFAICDLNGHPVAQAQNRWYDLLPFFEHGNFAIPATLAAQKRNLVAKAGDAIERILSDPNNGAVSLRYASAVDYSSTEHRNVLPPPASESLRQLLRDHVLRRPALVEFAEKGRLWIGEFDQGDPALKDHTACHLPEIIEGYRREWVKDSTQ
jgi:hypothetical protein